MRKTGIAAIQQQDYRFSCLSLSALRNLRTDRLELATTAGVLNIRLAHRRRVLGHQELLKRQILGRMKFAAPWGKESCFR